MATHPDPANLESLEYLVAALGAGWDGPPLLQRLHGLCTLARWASDEQRDTVTAARAAGATWREVGDAADLKANAAYAAYSPGREERLRRMAERMAERVPPLTPPDLPGVGVVEAARRLGVTNATVYARAKRGALKCITIDGRLRITDPAVTDHGPDDHCGSPGQP